jgi:hypothetical protein
MPIRAKCRARRVPRQQYPRLCLHGRSARRSGTSAAGTRLRHQRPGGLNEFANVARRKLGKPWEEIRDALAAIRTLCTKILPIDLETHAAALRLAERHGFAFFDALMIAAALQAGSDTLWSEDMQHGMTIDGRLRILNPFRAAG